jgi:nitrogen regulatory protein PII
VTVVCEDADAVSIAKLIAASSYTGRAGDGLITITPISNVVRIRDAKAGA